jgi:hypothetical protein
MGGAIESGMKRKRISTAPWWKKFVQSKGNRIQAVDCTLLPWVEIEALGGQQTLSAFSGTRVQTFPDVG